MVKYVLLVGKKGDEGMKASTSGVAEYLNKNADKL
jgi:hypothetical protein